MNDAYSRNLATRLLVDTGGGFVELALLEDVQPGRIDTSDLTF